MPVRKGLRSIRSRFQGLSLEPSRKSTPNDPVPDARPLQVDSPQAESDRLSVASAEINEAGTGSAHSIPPQHLKLQGCWREAYEELQKEQGDLIRTYEKFLLEKGGTEEPDDAQTDLHTFSHLRTLVEGRLQEIEKSRFKVTVAGKEIVIRAQARRAIHAMLSVKDLITTAVSTEPHAALAWAGALLLLSPITKSFTQDEDAMSAFEAISIILVRYRVVEHTNIEIYSDKSELSGTPPEELGASIRAQTVNLYAKIIAFQIRLAQHFLKSGFYRFVDDLGVTDDWTDLLQTITGTDKHISEQMNTLSQNRLKDIQLEVGEMQREMGELLDVMSLARDENRETKQISLLNTLPVSGGAAFNSYEDQTKSRCMEGTSVSTLTQVQDWYQSPTSTNICWLKGMAGTGKSTISRTVAASCYNHQPLVKGRSYPEGVCLAATFFFDQGKSDRKNTSKLFTSICKQLATLLPDTKDDICRALSDHPDIISRDMSEQWNHLILRPLLSLQGKVLVPLTLVIVIDALDECEKTEIERLLPRFAQLRELSTIRLKIFITSRPEAHVFSAFRQLQEGCEIDEYDLQKVPLMSDSNNQDDITRFITTELAISSKAHGFSKDWPGESTKTELALRADGLWIFAATTCRFFQEPGLNMTRAKRRLDLILTKSITDGTPLHNLDTIYRGILQYSVIDGVSEGEVDLVCGLFRKIIRCIVVLLEPMSKSALRDLIALDKDEVDDTLHGLYSVLSIEEDPNSTIKLLHLSFRDFLLEQRRCSDMRFWICQKAAHLETLGSCLRALSETLRENLYNIPHPSEGPAAADLSQAQFHVQYGALYWVNHLKSSACDPDDDGEVHTFLKAHFLHWIEFLSVHRKMPEAVSAVIELSAFISHLPAKGRTKLQAFVKDARRFILRFREIIESAPLQIYRSALVYCPEMSVIRKEFQGKIPGSYSKLPMVELNWSPLLQTLIDPERVAGMALSPDGKLVASSSVRIWEVTTGTLWKAFEPLGQGIAVAFSPCGQYLLSLSQEGNLRVWDIAKDELRQEVNSLFKDCSIYLHIFSHDRTLAACATTTEIQLIDVVNGRTLGLFKNPSDIFALTFSSDGKLLASGSEKDDTIRIWDTRTRSQTEISEYGAGDLSCFRVAISQDSKIIASLSDFETIRIWDLTTGDLLNKIEVDSEDIVFLPDNKTLLSGGDKVHFWDFVSGNLLRTIDDSCPGLGLSPDCRLLTSVGVGTGANGVFSCAGGNIRVWDIATGSLLKDIENTSAGWYEASFSPDNQFLAISSSDDGVQLWDLTVQTISKPRMPAKGGSSRDRLVLSPTHMAAAFNRCNMVSIWNAKTGETRDVVEHGFTVESHGRGALERSYAGGGSNVTVTESGSVVARLRYYREPLFSPEGTLLLTSHFRGGELWDTANGKLVWSISHCFESSGQWAFSPDGRLLSHTFKIRYRHGDKLPCEDWKDAVDPGSSSLDEPPIITIWDTRAHTVLYTLKGFYTSFLALAFSPDSTMFACIRKDSGPHSHRETRRLEIWDMTGDLQCRVSSAPAEIKPPLSWSPDGKTICCGSSAEIFLLFCAESATLQWSLDYSVKRNIFALAFSPDAKLLASIEAEISGYVSNQKTISVWDMSSRSRIGSCNIFDDVDHSFLQFSENGKAIHTDNGRMDIRGLLSGSGHHEDLFLDGRWIRYGQHEAILLPRDYEALRGVAAGNTLIMQHGSRHTTFFEFQEGS